MAMKPISWNEIRANATSFMHAWQGESRERAEAQSFINEFFQIFGISRRRVASFEEAVKKLGGGQGFIDGFWRGVMLIEMKSAGKDLEDAINQAFEYFHGLTEAELPRYIMVSDFARIRLRDLEEGTDHEFPLDKLLEHIHLFGFIAGYEKRVYDDQNPVNLEAAEKMGGLHDRLKQAGYRGHDLQVYLVRLLFCLFAEDTGIFNRGAFRDLIEDRSSTDGSDLAGLLDSIFDTLNTPVDERMTTLDDEIALLPYVNGKLFSERLRPAAFNREMRQILLDACQLDWGAISPAIFGSLFQSVMNPEQRRSLGAHYTSEKNILKLIQPLFLDDLYARFEQIKGNTGQLHAFHQELAKLRIIDPACGCGNFLVIAYRELRRLELEVLKALEAHNAGQRFFNIEALVRLNVDMMFGIEIEEFPSQIAQVALWLIDHQMNLEVAQAFGEYFRRLPLTTSPNILHGNALTADWETCFGDKQPEQFSYILGNPPFIGKQFQTSEQKQEHSVVFGKTAQAGVLDYVCCWFVKAADYMVTSPSTMTAFVATNSISQGQQVGILWSILLNKGDFKINFAHRTFVWGNDARGNAAVHVVIIGFSLQEIPARLFDYEDGKGDASEITVPNINPYLVNANNTLVLSRKNPAFIDKELIYGSFALDDGNFTLSPKEREEILKAHPEAEKFIKPFIGGRELLNGIERWCLWLKDAQPGELKNFTLILHRVRKVQDWRTQSGRATTNKLAETPTLFAEVRQPDTNYLAIPTVSSERRKYIPIAFLSPDIIASNQLYILPNATLWEFGILTSTMHMAWIKYVGGRLKSDYRYSAGLVYNTFPWPDEPSVKRKQEVETAAEAILIARQPYLNDGATLADLYDPLTMPPDLLQAHRKLDRLVDLLYRPQAFPREANRMAHLFERYEALTCGNVPV